MRKYKIFLASSAELDEDKENFEMFISKKNKEWINRNVFLELITWKDFIDAMSETHSQNEYNKAIRKCDFFVVLFHTKLGRYTNVEFETAYDEFKKNTTSKIIFLRKKKPLIFTYFKKEENEIIDLEIDQFKNKVDQLGHFYSLYKNYDELNYKFNQQLERLVNEGIIKYDTLNWTKIITYTTFFIAIPIAILLFIYNSMVNSKPFNMTVLIKEKNPIAGSPYQGGNLRLIYNDKQESTYVSNEAIFKQIPGNLRDKKASLIFDAKGYKKIDTIIALEESILMQIEHDESLAKLSGYIIDEDGRPLEGVDINIEELTAKSDSKGRFEINIPRSKQAEVQTVMFYKRGYKTIKQTANLLTQWEIKMGVIK